MYIDEKYIDLLSPQLNKFKKVKSGLYNFRCPFCGDSKKNKNRARGYLYTVENKINFKCHNCEASMSLKNFMREVDETLYKSYALELFKERSNSDSVERDSSTSLELPTPVFKKKLNLPLASEVEVANQYLLKRHIDPSKFYYSEGFKSWINKLTNTQKFSEKSLYYDDERIVIPMYDVNKNLIGVQGRCITSNQVKYITIMLNEKHPKVYGLETINKEETIYIAEGPFDSTFIPNSIAMCGSDISLDSLKLKSKLVYVLDNEPRNREILSKILKLINNNEYVVIWPDTIIEKDINKMIQEGMSKEQVLAIIKENTFSGLTAKLKFNQWKKV